MEEENQVEPQQVTTEPQQVTKQPQQVTQVTKEPQRVTTKNPKKVEAGKRLAESNRKKREAKKQVKLEASGVNQYYGIGAVIALGVIGGLGYYIYRSKKGEDTGKLVAIVATSEMTREYLIKQKILSDHINI